MFSELRRGLHDSVDHLQGGLVTAEGRHDIRPLDPREAGAIFEGFAGNLDTQRARLITGGRVSHQIADPLGDLHPRDFVVEEFGVLRACKRKQPDEDGERYAGDERGPADREKK